MHSKHLHVGRGGFTCPCCFPAPGTKARKAEFRKAKRQEDRHALAVGMAEFADEQTWRCASCDRWIEDGEPGPHCQHCRWYWEDYARYAFDEFLYDDDRLEATSREGRAFQPPYED